MAQHHNTERALEQQIEGYRQSDPTPKPKLVVLVAVPQGAMAMANNLKVSPKTQATDNLIITAFFFSLE